MSVLVELVRWWSLATGLCAVLLVVLVLAQSAQQLVRRRAVHRRPHGSASTAVVGQPLPH